MTSDDRQPPADPKRRSHRKAVVGPVISKSAAPYAVRRRAMTAIDRAMKHYNHALRWEFIANAAPPGTRIHARAVWERQEHARKANEYIERVRIALGWDPHNEDEGRPLVHPDRGANDPQDVADAEDPDHPRLRTK